MNSEKPRYWFPAKTYGWGWGIPCSWQGWVVLLVYLALVAMTCFLIDPAKHLKTWIAAIWGLSILLVLICWWKGERPAWRWGKTK